MQYAFDTIVRRMVSAETAAKGYINEPFRYECLCCGEEVRLAAKEGRKQTPHFRHLRGNGDRDCELYFSSWSPDGTSMEAALTAAEKRERSVGEILYDTEEKLFYLSVSFSEEKIRECEEKNIRMELHTDSGQTTTLRIDRSNFAPDSPMRFPLTLTSNFCRLSFSEVRSAFEPLYTEYEILKPIDFPTFFKFRAGDEKNGLAKRHADGIIYTETRYYALAFQRGELEKLLFYAPEVELGQIEEITALGGVIYGAELTIGAVSRELQETMAYFGYELQQVERITLLWPPAYSVDGELRCRGDTLFLSSTFALKAGSNISCGDEALSYRGEYYTLGFSGTLAISRNNGKRLNISSEQENLPLEVLAPLTEYAKTVEVETESRCYRIGKDGCRLLSPGKYFLTPGVWILCCRGNYVDKVFRCRGREEVSPVKRLMEIRKYYNRVIPFSEEHIGALPLSRVAEIYVEECRKTGEINAKVLEYIKAGKI